MSRVLVIDDTAEIRGDIAFILTEEGFEVQEAENGRKGIEIAQSWAPDVIVCDINMPQMNGYEVLEHIRNLAVTRITPFIFLTARSEHMDMREAMAAGADDFIPKPFRPAELLNSIRAQIHKTAMRIKATEDRLRELSDNITTAVPHELRTPLNTVSGFADMLMREAHEVDAEQIVEWARHIKEAGQRLYQLIEHQILYVRLQVWAQTPEKQAEYARSHLADIHNMVEMIATQIGDKSGRWNDLQFDLEAAPPVAMNYPDLIKILTELLDNAFKFSSADHPVRVVGRQADSTYLLIVEDQGRGMTSEQIKHVGPYMQFDRGIYQQPGLGLGLAIVREIVELYGGHMEITCVPGQGTQVTLHLKCV